jgi:hypothetical protein
MRRIYALVNEGGVVLAQKTFSQDEVELENAWLRCWAFIVKWVESGDCHALL